MPAELKALIVDDERLARKELISLLAAFEHIQIVGEAEDVSAARQAIQQFEPDVIFLDIQMPGSSGFDLLDQIETQAKVVFVTAFDEYAIRAFDVNALDYLLKPVNPERLKSTVERLDAANTTENNASRSLSYDDRLFLMLDTQWRFLKVNTILCIIAEGDYTEVLTDDGKKRLSVKPMKEWESRLPAQNFCRIHRSTLVNLEYVERMEEWFHHSFRVYLKGLSTPFVLSRRFAAKLKEKFS